VCVMNSQLGVAHIKTKNRCMGDLNSKHVSFSCLECVVWDFDSLNIPCVKNIYI
jgi:hypothetical protein